ncbi:MAG TPA: hypothetical protein O0X39_01185 [Methanocorpusculum sp.]|nr:hypothetical protein [Methanocorpusculum sp.]
MPWEKPPLTKLFPLSDCTGCPRYSEALSTEGGFYPVCSRQGDLHDMNYCRILEYGGA